jgi:hypothetical protein
MTENIKTGDVLEAWKEVVESGQPHSSVRLGDAQIIVAAHEEILSMKFVNKLCRWANDHLPDSKLPDKKLQEQLVWALHQADFLGVFCQTEHWNLKPLSDMVIQYYDIKPSRFFYAFDNFYISKDPRFYEYFKDTKVLLIGAKAGKLKEVLERRYGWTGIAGTVDCPNWKSFEKAMQNIPGMWESLSAAGPIPASRLMLTGLIHGSGIKIRFISLLNPFQYFRFQFIQVAPARIHIIVFITSDYSQNRFHLPALIVAGSQPYIPKIKIIEPQQFCEFFDIPFSYV